MASRRQMKPSPDRQTPQPLQRRLGVLDSTAIGLGSMLGAGVFVVFAPAAALAGPLLAAAVALAGVIAYCNAVASAQLAAVYPASGGSYVYGRNRLGEWPGFIAGWGFVTGKTASCAAMALTFGHYAAPEFATPLAVAAVAVLTGVNLLGITRTALLTRILLGAVLTTLAFVAAAALLGPHPAADPAAGAATAGGGWGVLPAAGLMFFAFAGYARIATLGEEVKDPARTIPRAIFAALAAAFIIYLGLALLLARHLPDGQLAGSTAPLLDAVAGSRLSAGAPLVQAGAAAACLGALLALITGVGRTTMAMAREGDLPAPLARVGGTHPVPFLAELAVAAAVIVLLLTTNVLTVVGYSSFGVLVYYAVTNAAAFTLAERPGHAPRWLNAVGFLGCLLLAVTLPPASVLGMAAVLGAGAAGRVLALRRRLRKAAA
ncbi:APC family permease [Arthrobacter sp. AL08]|uniref:APC family permease n=1 Tax=Micrococcaceae TaxID=1268 RepID=UPI001CFFC58D|nr:MULTISPECIES: APC family permease [Micrococcaceae]MCB5282505.1 putative transporter [Arthrobacter sp. ES1]MDI3242833.1 APC family permease [Arthrobacter sp. AL05]MDI3278904.1 APC family permease [Arthrobacter sp. AL08]MDJ0351603.1 APC family permease [Pseudarthrobacter sp. PH31-O2]WGZ81253.1 APC family permease [Arthrobacter sp. EM1]